MKKIHFLFIVMLAFYWSGCEHLSTIQKTLEGATGSNEPSTTEIIAGLKQALEVGTGNAVGILNKTDGYYGDNLVKIPFPPQAIKVDQTLRTLGAGPLVDEFIKLMNRGAERAAAQAKPIFVNAVKTMTISDAKNILFGADNAATNYFKSKTTKPLYDAFAPKVKQSLDVVNATKYWNDVTSRYNKIPLVQPVNTDLTDYATNKALDGLFLKLADEEKKIRKNPVERITALLKKVFGALDNR